MNRRSFFTKMIGGVSAAAAVRTFPFRVFSFPKQVEIIQPIAVKFVRAFDPTQSKFISRWDVLYGFGHLEAGPEGRVALFS